jgi:hypothetical protein
MLLRRIGDDELEELGESLPAPESAAHGRIAAVAMFSQPHRQLHSQAAPTWSL